MKRLVDCIVFCNGDQLDFNVWPKKGESSEAACLRLARKWRPGKNCSVIRHRRIDGISGIRSDQVRLATDRALNYCWVEYKDRDRIAACQNGVSVLVSELRSQNPSLDKATTRHFPIRFRERLPRVKIVRES